MIRKRIMYVLLKIFFVLFFVRLHYYWKIREKNIDIEILK